jgi:hypothetical protein
VRNAKIVGSEMNDPMSINVMAAANPTAAAKVTRTMRTIKTVANHKILCAVSVLNFNFSFPDLQRVTSP